MHAIRAEMRAQNEANIAAGSWRTKWILVVGRRCELVDVHA